MTVLTQANKNNPSSKVKCTLISFLNYTKSGKYTKSSKNTNDGAGNIFEHDLERSIKVVINRKNESFRIPNSAE